MNRYRQFTTLMRRCPILVDHLINAILLAHYIAWIMRLPIEASHWLLLHIILLVHHLGLHHDGISIRIELLLLHVHFVIGRLHAVLILVVWVSRHHCHACIRIVDCEIVCMSWIIIYYNWFFSGIAVGFESVVDLVSFLSSLFYCFITFFDAIINEIVYKTDKAASGDDTTDHNCNIGTSTVVITSIAIAITIAAVVSTTARTGT